ncbi:MAG: hypothetical protein ACO1SV_14040 [Fimbriimonas sp.]
MTIHHIDFDRVPEETLTDPTRMLAAQFVFLTPTTEEPKSKRSVFLRYPE